MNVIRKESEYLFLASKERCKSLLDKPDIIDDDIIEILINLHLVLEIGFNIFFRHLLWFSRKDKAVEKSKFVNEIDRIGLREKFIIFLYVLDFDFPHGSEDEIQKKRNEVLGKLANFCEVRNKLLHGYSIYEERCFPARDGGDLTIVESPIKKKLTYDNLHKQIVSYKLIMQHLAYFMLHFNSECLGKNIRNDLIRNYLEFLKNEIYFFGDVK